MGDLAAGQRDLSAAAEMSGLPFVDRIGQPPLCPLKQLAALLPSLLSAPDTFERSAAPPSQLALVAVPDQEAEGPGPVAEVHKHIPGLLSRPGAGGVGGHAQDVHMPGGDLHHEQDVEASEGNCVHMEEVAGQQPLRLSAGTLARRCPCSAEPVCAAGRAGSAAGSLR